MTFSVAVTDTDMDAFAAERLEAFEREEQRVLAGRKRREPAESIPPVTVARVPPLPMTAWFDNMILTPTRTAPELSVTFPLMVPVVVLTA
jgi:hypothetical protein